MLIPKETEAGFFCRVAKERRYVNGVYPPTFIQENAQATEQVKFYLP